MTLEQDFDYCRNIIKNSSKSFYRAFSTLPSRKAKAIYTIYAFCRICDDIIDVHKDHEGLLELKKELKLFNEGNYLNSPMWRALRWVFDTYDMKIAPFSHMIQGQEIDASFSGINTQRQLLSYCYFVAGTVGLMIEPVVAVKNHNRVHSCSVKLGQAMQITNILRDIGEDFEKGRVYIPKQVMESFNYTEEDLSNRVINGNFIAMWEYEASIAERLYKEALIDIHLFDKDSINAVLLSAKLYKEILNSVRRNDYDCLTVRNHVSKYKKYSTILKTLAEVKFGQISI